MKPRIFSFFLLILFSFAGCSRGSEPPRTALVLGTVCTVNVFEKGSAALYDRLFERLRIIEQLMSTNIADSEISRINAAAGKEAVAVSSETFFVISEAVEFARLSDGAFDPTVGPLVRLWGIGSDTPRVPQPKEIAEALALVDYRQIKLDVRGKTVFLQKKGMLLDVGGIAKGYAADVLAGMLREAGIKRALIDLGGNVYALGSREDGTPWRIGIKNPEEPNASPPLRLEIRDKSVVTSGTYERFFLDQGEKYHHILNTKIGYPVKNGVESFTIISHSSLKADALSTACFALGREDGISLANSLEDVEAVCIANSNEIFKTVNAAVQILNSSFTQK